MIKKEKISKDNIVNFPSKLTEIEKEIEAVIFAAAEPLEIDTIESKISKKTDVLKILKKLENEYSMRGINQYVFQINGLLEPLKIFQLLCLKKKQLKKNYQEQL